MKKIPMGTKVEVSIFNEIHTGEVVGVASKEIIPIYIISLDSSLNVDGEYHSAIVLPASEMTIVS